MVELTYEKMKKKIWKKIIVELFRLKKMGELYGLYVNIHKKYNIPVKNFNRWIFSHSLYPSKKADPVIPNKSTYEELHDIFYSAFKKKGEILDIKKITDELLLKAKMITKDIKKKKIKIDYAKLTYENDLFIIEYHGSMIKSCVERFDHQSFGKCNTFPIGEIWKKHVDYKIMKRLDKLYNGSSEIKYLRIFRLIVRYENMEFERNNQGASPKKIFEILEKSGCEMELFAAPQYSYFNKFCSAYYDTDKYFGSRGSFMNFFPKNGIYQGAPINSNYFLNSILKHIVDILRDADNICFILFLPDWDDLEYLNIIDKINGCKKYIIPKNVQIYESKNIDKKSIITIVPNSSRIYFIQKNMNIDHKKIYDEIIELYTAIVYAKR